MTSQNHYKSESFRGVLFFAFFLFMMIGFHQNGNTNNLTKNNSSLSSTHLAINNAFAILSDPSSLPSNTEKWQKFNKGLLSSLLCSKADRAAYQKIRIELNNSYNTFQQAKPKRLILLRNLHHKSYPGESLFS